MNKGILYCHSGFSPESSLKNGFMDSRIRKNDNAGARLDSGPGMTEKLEPSC